MTLKPDYPPKPRKFTIFIWLVLIVLLGVLAYFVHAYWPKGKAVAAPQHWDKSSKVAVSSAVALRQNVPVYLNGLGTVTALRTVAVRSRIDGELIRVLFKEGQTVNAGDVLAEIDPRAYAVQVQQAEGQLQRDLALLKNAEIDLQRYKTLLAQDSISTQQTVTQESLVKQYYGTVAMDKAAVANAKLQLSYTRMTAPVSGRLGLRLVDQGNMVHANDANGLAVITQVQPISVIFTLPEDTLPSLTRRLHTDKTLIVEAYDRSGKNKLAQGSLLALDNQIDLNTGTIKLKSQFDNRDGALFVNQFVNVKMLVDNLLGVVTVNVAAIQNDNNGAYVFVIKEGQTVQVRPVKLGVTYDDQVVVEEGLAEHEKVVLEGADKLNDGEQVKLIERDIVKSNDNSEPEIKTKDNPAPEHVHQHAEKDP